MEVHLLYVSQAVFTTNPPILESKKTALGRANVAAPVEELNPTCILQTLTGGQQVTERVHIHKQLLMGKPPGKPDQDPQMMGSWFLITDEKIYASHF